MKIKLFIGEALRVAVWINAPPKERGKDAQVLIGSLLAVTMEVRDTDDSLMVSDVAFPVDIRPVDENAQVGATVKTAMALQDVNQEDLSKIPGRYVARIDSTGLAAGKYLVRVTAPADSGKVLAQIVFDLVDPDNLE